MNQDKESGKGEAEAWKGRKLDKNGQKKAGEKCGHKGPGKGGKGTEENATRPNFKQKSPQLGLNMRENELVVARIQTEGGKK